MRTHVKILGTILVIVLIGVLAWAAWPDTARLSVNAVAGRVPELTRPRNQSIPTVDVAKAVGWAKGAHPTPAKGLIVNAFATGLDHPRWIYRLPDGDILVAETNAPPGKGGGITGMIARFLKKRAGAATPSANRITLLRDTNGDGVADLKTPFITGLNSPFGMVLLDNTLYVADTDALLAFPYKTGETQITAKPRKLTALPSGGEHWTRSLIYDPKEKHLLVGIGSSTNIADNGLEADKTRAAIWSVDPQTGQHALFATGMRNPVGMAINPQSGNLWAVVDERDKMGSDMPPDYLTQVDFGNFYGWPWAYWGGYEDRRVTPFRPDLLEYTARPDYALGAHVTPLGLVFTENAKLGPSFAQGAAVAEHGSWNRRPPSGYKVVYVPFAGDGFPVKNSKPVDLLTGFLNAKGQAQGRPVGLAISATGALLVADDVGNTIWRVSSAAPAQASAATPAAHSTQ